MSVRNDVVDSLDLCGSDPQIPETFAISSILVTFLLSSHWSKLGDQSWPTKEPLVTGCREHGADPSRSPFPFRFHQGPKVQAGCYGKNSEHGARRPRHKPWHHLYCLTLDKSINLPCFSLPIREYETNIYLQTRGFGEILTTDALSTDPDMYQVLKMVFAESTLRILLHWGQ